MKQPERHAPYISDALCGQRALVGKAKKTLAGIKFDGFVGSGLSGALVVPLLAYTMKKRFAIVRKKDDKSTHYECIVEDGLDEGDDWIFVDDFLCTGATTRRVNREMERIGYKKKVASYYYNQCDELIFTCDD